MERAVLDTALDRAPVNEDALRLGWNKALDIVEHPARPCERERGVAVVAAPGRPGETGLT